MRVTQRLRNKWRRFTTRRYARRDFPLRSNVPYISFTFDDFPRSALLEGGRILEEHGVRGTYFVSFKLLGGASPSGPIALKDDLYQLLSAQHDLGCHTFEHLDGTIASAADFERSIDTNKRALIEAQLETEFAVFAYPLDGPVVSIKTRVGKRFVACRGGGQTYNHSVLDLNLLSAYFLDRRNRAPLSGIAELIRANAQACGWLIFATHDVRPNPSEYGCEPSYFGDVVELSIQSGAKVLPMTQVCKELGLPWTKGPNTLESAWICRAPS